jgi:hypothetical protein
MTALSTLTLVRIAHEAEDAGRLDAAEHTLAEVAPDFEYVRRTSGGVQLRALVPEFVVEDEYRDMTPDEAQFARIDAAGMWRRINWTKWIDCTRASSPRASTTM